MNKVTISYLILFFGIILLIFSSLLVYSEIKSAKEGCELKDGVYSFKGIHFCNGEPIYQYEIWGKKVWLYKMEIPDLKNLSMNWSIFNNS